MIGIERDGPITIVTIRRPAARNAVDPATARALYQAFLAFEADESAAVAILTGEGAAFCAGYDLKAAADLAREATPLGELAFTGEEPSQGPMGPTRLELSKPVIAAIAGPAVAGGLELALWCDMRVVDQTGYFGVYCRRWGVPLVDGGTVRLPRIVGEGRALDLILTGRKVEAEEALRIGLADRLVPAGTALEAARSLARDIARFPQACMRADRRSARAQHGLPVAAALRQEWVGSIQTLAAEGVAGAARFAGGAGRSGSFDKI